MPWVKLDDGFARHPKVLLAGPLGLAMQVAGLCYCNQYATDGLIPREAAKTLLDFEGLAFSWQHNEMFGSANDVEADMVIKHLVEVGLWLEAPGGYKIHDYLEYQPSRAEVLAKRRQRVEAGRKGGLAKAKQTSSESLSKSSSKPEAKVWPVPDPVPVPLKSLSLTQNTDSALNAWAKLQGTKPTDTWKTKRRAAVEDFLEQHPELTMEKLNEFLVWAKLSKVAEPQGWPSWWPVWPGSKESKTLPDCPICENRRMVPIEDSNAFEPCECTDG